MKKIILSTVCASLLTITANADFLGAEAGYALWTPALTGTIKNGSDLVDMEKDLGFGDKENNSFVWAYLDHPLPLIPNVKIQQTNSCIRFVWRRTRYSTSPIIRTNGRH